MLVQGVIIKNNNFLSATSISDHKASELRYYPEMLKELNWRTERRQESTRA